MSRLTPYDYQMMAELGQALSQSRAIALAAIPQALIRVEAWQDRIGHRQSYRRSQQQMRPYRWDIPEATLRQITLYQVLEEWEKRQERQGQLMPKEFLIRYVKCLVLHTMMQDASHVAMALGCRLYRYDPGHIESLAPDVIAMPWRLRRDIDQVITARFRTLDLNRTRAPTPAEQRLVHNLLSRLAPWAPSHPNTSTPLAVLFAQHTSPQRGAQIHVLIDTQGACGLAQLIREYNTSLQETRAVLKQWFKDGLGQPGGRLPAELAAFFRQLWRVFGPRYDLPDPDTHLGIPALPGMDGPESGADMDTDDAETFSSLTPDEMAHIEASLQLQQRRLAQYRPGLLQVCVNGEPVGEFDVRVREAWRLQLPRWASSVEVYGHDAEGPLLLAVFPVAGVAPYEMGRTIQFLLAVARRAEDGEPAQNLVTLTYLESPWATALALWERGLQGSRRLCRHLGWHAIVAVTAIVRGSLQCALWGGQLLSTPLGRAVVPGVVAAGLVLLVLWPTITHLRIELAQVRTELAATPAAFQKVAHEASLQAQTFPAPGHQPERAMVGESLVLPGAALEAPALIKAATTAAAYCQYEMADRILAENITATMLETPRQMTAWFLARGLLAHSLGDLDTAQALYAMVLKRAGQSPESQEEMEEAWFRLGVVHAMRYGASHAVQEKQQAINAIRQSLRIAAARSRMARERRAAAIALAQVPFPERPQEACGEAAYRLHDLRALGLHDLRLLQDSTQG